jgi:hypothetical protein
VANIRNKIPTYHKKKAWRRGKEDRTTKSRSEYEEIAKRVKKRILGVKRKLERELANEDKGNGRKFRNYIKQRTRSRDPVGPLITKNGTTITEDKDLAEELNNYFSSIFTKEDKENLPVKEPETDKRLDRLEVTRGKVLKKIKKLRPDSAAGPDGIHPRLLIECAELLSEPLAIIFNKSLGEKYVPPDWKEAVITPIYKKGKRTDPGNYRPVSRPL